MNLAELLQGPVLTEIAPFIAEGNDGAVLAALTRKDIPAYGTVTTNDFVIWAAGSGQRAVIEDTANNVSDPLRSVALALQDLVRGNLQQGLDFSRAETLAMAQAWLTAGKMNQAAYDALLGLSTRMISLADQAGLSPTIQDIAQALRG